jgi:hypothetical protein
MFYARDKLQNKAFRAESQGARLCSVLTTSSAIANNSNLSRRSNLHAHFRQLTFFPSHPHHLHTHFTLRNAENCRSHSTYCPHRRPVLRPYLPICSSITILVSSFLWRNYCIKRHVYGQFPDITSKFPVIQPHSFGMFDSWVNYTTVTVALTTLTPAVSAIPSLHMRLPLTSRPTLLNSVTPVHPTICSIAVSSVKPNWSLHIRTSEHRPVMSFHIRFRIYSSNCSCIIVNKPKAKGKFSHGRNIFANTHYNTDLHNIHLLLQLRQPHKYASPPYCHNSQ